MDQERRPLGWVEPRRLRGTPVTEDSLHRGGTVAHLDGTARAVLDAALSAPSGRGVVVDEAGVLLGTVTAAAVVGALPAHPGSSAAESPVDGVGGAAG